jgi:tetratricopeptide (TPR) repeat protein
MTSLRALTVALLAAVVFVPVAALAQPTEAQKREAKELNEKATRLYEVGKYGEAIEEYQKVYLLVDDPVLLYNIAQSYRLWGKPEDSVRFYRNYLRRAPGAPNRADVEKKIADQEKLIEERRRAPVTTPPVTTPPVETPTTTPTPPVTTTPPPITTTTPPPLQPAPVVVSGTDESGHHGRRVTAYVLLIGGGVMLATAAVSGSVASAKAKELERMSKDPLRPTFDPSIEKAGKTANGVAILTGIVGAAMGVTGGILLLTSSGSSERPVALFPLVGPRLAGGGARVTF